MITRVSVDRRSRYSQFVTPGVNGSQREAALPATGHRTHHPASPTRRLDASRDPRAAAPTSPILSLASVMGPLSIIQIFSHAMTVSTVAPALATMIGLGVGIDYALFIVTSR